MQLRVQVLKFSFVPARPLTFPNPASNKLRGLIGKHLRERGDGSYQRFFDPTLAAGPSGLSDPPRPFVLRAAHLNGSRVLSGAAFHFDLHLFDLRAAFPDIRGMLDGASGEVTANEPFALGLDPPATPVAHIRVRFLTPTELKSRGEVLDKPEFGILAARVRDRLGTLSQIYGEGPLPIDFAAFGERARAVKMTRCQIQHVDAQRRSGSTGQTHALSGFVGEAEYQGDLTEFIPYLRAAQWTGVGRQTTWGKGAIALQE